MTTLVAVLLAVGVFAWIFYPRTPKHTATGPVATTATAPVATTPVSSTPSKSIPAWKLVIIFITASMITAILAPGIINRINGTPNGADEVIERIKKSERPQIVIVQPTPTVVASTPGDDIRWGTNYLYPGKRYYFDRLVNFYVLPVREEDHGKKIRFQKEGFENRVYWDLILFEVPQKTNKHDDRSTRGRFYFTVEDPVMVTITQDFEQALP